MEIKQDQSKIIENFKVVSKGFATREAIAEAKTEHRGIEHLDGELYSDEQHDKERTEPHEQSPEHLPLCSQLGETDTAPRAPDEGPDADSCCQIAHAERAEQIGFPRCQETYCCEHRAQAEADEQPPQKQG